MKKTIRTYIQSERLLKTGDMVLVALSGGADSVALLRVLLSLDYRVEAAHCNFHLRGAESDRDEAFVHTLCERLYVPLHVAQFNTADYAAAHGLSLEMAAREQRYAWFEEVRCQVGAAAIAVAHHRDDSVETMLLNLLRGTGLRGLTGIQPRRGYIIRPLLAVGRSDILSYLDKLGQDYVTDSTNLHDDFRRNKIRLRVLPLLQELNPSVADTLDATAHRLRQVETVYLATIEAGKHRVMDGDCRIHIGRLLQEPSPQALLHEILQPLDFNAAQQQEVFAALQAESGRRFRAAEWELLRDRTHLLLRRFESAKEFQEEAPELEIRWLDVTPDFVIPRQREVACLDADRIQTHPLTLRRPRPADRFVPFGMRGSKLLSDYFTDRKFTAYEKERQWVVCCGEDIVWLVNERPDARFCVTPSTRRVALVSLKG